jgi:hypothetical protein
VFVAPGAEYKPLFRNVGDKVVANGFPGTIIEERVFTGNSRHISYRIRPQPRTGHHYKDFWIQAKTLAKQEGWTV